MFIIEKALRDHQRATSNWEAARDKWVNDPKFQDHYRDERTYERNHPRPTNWLPVIGKSVAIGVCVGLFVVLFVGFVKEIDRETTTKENTSQVKEQ